ncbi:hypothetical protein GGR97_000825 [Wenyingzhuangia aestuarii]|nr:hypothetical protein [Wenyingzhuangia aestuarii]
MALKQEVVNKESVFIKRVRIAHIISYVIFLLLLVFEDLRSVAAYFYIGIYIWVMILYAIFELRYIIITKKKDLKYLFSNRLFLLGIVVLIFNIIRLLK